MTGLKCPALFLSSPASGQGKTTFTAMLARLLRDQGKQVVVFKCGPDFLDPKILHLASGQPVVPIDLWMAGEDWCQQQLYQAAQRADLILVEGAMGLFDGDPSSADLAIRFNIPVAIVLDVKGMAQTAAAVASGLSNYRNDLHVVGVIANKCASERHQQLISDALPRSLPLLTAVQRNGDVSLPQRHLGLVQPREAEHVLQQCLSAGVRWLQEGGIEELIKQIKPVEFYPVSVPTVEPLLAGMRIAIAKDAAFSFIYDANVQVLIELGAQLQYFSPLQDKNLPEVDAVWLPGGYPELHAQALSVNQALITALRDFYRLGKTIFAECGGMLYCLQSLTDLDGQRYSMSGLLPGHGAMRGKRGCQGMQTAMLPEGEVRAHAHHRSRSSDTPNPIAYGKRQHHSAPGEAIYRQGGLTATYLHLFFASNPIAIARLFNPALQSELKPLAYA